MIIMINGSLHKRLSQRDHTEQSIAWIKERIELCISAFESPVFATHIATDDKSPEEILTEIITRIN